MGVNGRLFKKTPAGSLFAGEVRYASYLEMEKCFYDSFLNPLFLRSAQAAGGSHANAHVLFYESLLFFRREGIGWVWYWFECRTREGILSLSVVS